VDWRYLAIFFKDVLVIAEAFSKWIDLVPLWKLTAIAVTLAFRERVLAHFGRPVEVTSDNGAEYKAEFHQLCLDLGIDHRMITPGHPEANGLVERIVQVLKKALHKYVLIHGVVAWPEHLPTTEFGYRTTPQRSTRFSPYFLVYGRQPTYSLLLVLVTSCSDLRRIIIRRRSKQCSTEHQ